MSEAVLNHVYDRSGGDSSRLWRVTQGGHKGALTAVPAEYGRRVAGFLDRALPGDRPAS